MTGADSVALALDTGGLGAMVRRPEADAAGDRELGRQTMADDFGGPNAAQAEGWNSAVGAS